MAMEYILLAGPILFVIITIFIGIITPNYSHKHNYISELSLGKYGWLQKINFIVSGLLISGLCLLLLSDSQSLIIKFGWGLGSIVGFSLFLTGVWDTDFGKPERTRAGKLHESVYNLAIPATGAVYFLLGWGYRTNPIILLFSWLIAVSSFVLYKFSERINLKHGVSQRIVVFSAIIWMEILALLTLFK